MRVAHGTALSKNTLTPALSLKDEGENRIGPKTKTTGLGLPLNKCDAPDAYSSFAILTMICAYGVPFHIT